MYIAEVISPSEQEHFKCMGCDLSYTSIDYKILLHNTKLAYFAFGEVEDPKSKMILNKDLIADCLCHVCMYSLLSQEAGDEPLKFKIVHGDAEHWSVVDNQSKGGLF